MFGSWDLGFIWSLELGIWSFGLPLTTDNGPLKTNDERPSLRLPPIVEDPVLHRRGRAHLRAGHRGEHRDFQRCERGTASTTADSRAGSGGPSLGDLARRRHSAGGLAE